MFSGCHGFLNSRRICVEQNCRHFPNLATVSRSPFRFSLLRPGAICYKHSVEKQQNLQVLVYIRFFSLLFFLKKKYIHFFKWQACLISPLCSVLREKRRSHQSFSNVFLSWSSSTICYNDSYLSPILRGSKISGMLRGNTMASTYQVDLAAALL